MATSTNPARSVSDLLADLTAKIAFHQSEEKLCAEQEEHFRERRSFHAAELERATRTHEALQAAVAAAEDIAPLPVPAEAPSEDLGSRSRPKLTRMIDLVLAALPQDAHIGARQVTVEVNRRFGAHLSKPADLEQVALTLKRRAQAGRLHRLRRGRPYHEALYARKPPA